MSDLLRIGASGVNAYRSALSVIGDNVANADTAGYVRRDVTLREAPAAGGSGPYYRGVVTGSGVNAVSVTRAWDAFKAESARSSAADAGRADARAQWLGAVETALPDDDSGISAKVTGFFSAATQLAADPTSTLARSTALSALGDAAGAIGSGATALGKVADGVAADAQSTVASVNGSLASLATLNQAIARTGAGTDTKASLEDQRDSLLDDLAAKIGIDADVAADGSVSVSLAGANGTTLVSGNRAATVALAVGGDGRLSLAIGGSGVAATGGKLAGLVDAANGVASTRASLDATAANFATQLNGWQAKGLNGNGAPGQPLPLACQDWAGTKLRASRCWRSAPARRRWRLPRAIRRRSRPLRRTVRRTAISPTSPTCAAATGPRRGSPRS